VTIGIIAAVLLILMAGMGFFLAGFSMTGKRQTLEEARAWQEDHYDLSWYDPLEKTDYTVKSGDGYVLHAQLLKNPQAADRCVIISHGYTDNRFGALKYARMYLDMGFDVIVYDLRGHGLNAPTFCTYSVRESRDLLSCMGIHGRIVHTPSHSEDSISLVLDDGNCFVGDLEPLEYLDA